jgi:acyl carrier protein
MTKTTPESLRSAVLDALLEVAPDVDACTLDAARPFREQFDFDSMDQLSFVVSLHKRLGVDVPETDYPQLASLAGCVDYLSRTMGGS